MFVIAPSNTSDSVLRPRLGVNWLKPDAVVATLGAREERREERIPEQLRRFPRNRWEGSGAERNNNF